MTLAIVVLGGVVSRRAVQHRDQRGAAGQAARAPADGVRAGSRGGWSITQVATVSLLMFFGSMAAIVAYRVANVDLGYDTRNLLSSSVELPEDRYPDAESRGRFYQTLYDQLAARPELDGVVLTGTARRHHRRARSSSK